VAGIFGMPREGQPASPYRIDKIPNPTPDRPEIYDYWPVCYDPDHLPSTGVYDTVAAEMGAAGGLRIQAFLNEFPARNRLASSICEADFAPAMSRLASRLSSP
jgi:hypothetical protein